MGAEEACWGWCGSAEAAVIRRLPVGRDDDLVQRRLLLLLQLVDIGDDLIRAGDGERAGDKVVLHVRNDQGNLLCHRGAPG